MAKFEKGKSGNEGGRPKLPEDVKVLVNATGEQAKRDLCQCYNSSVKDLTSIIDDPNISAGLRMLASCMLQSGDSKIMSAFLDRIIGKPTENVNLNSEGFKIVVEDYTRKK